MTVSATATAARQLIGGSMGTYLVQANVNGANVTFGSDYKGVIVNGMLAVPVCTPTGTPVRTITVQAPGYAVYTANITACAQETSRPLIFRYTDTGDTTYRGSAGFRDWHL